MLDYVIQIISQAVPHLILSTSSWVNRSCINTFQILKTRKLECGRTDLPKNISWSSIIYWKVNPSIWFLTDSPWLILYTHFVFYLFIESIYFMFIKHWIMLNYSWIFLKIFILFLIKMNILGMLVHFLKFW